MKPILMRMLIAGVTALGLASACSPSNANTESRIGAKKSITANFSCPKAKISLTLDYSGQNKTRYSLKSFLVTHNNNELFDLTKAFSPHTEKVKLIEDIAVVCSAKQPSFSMGIYNRRDGTTRAPERLTFRYDKASQDYLISEK